jgi:hypothetical protein
MSTTADQSSPSARVSRRAPSVGARSGYLASIAVNLICLFVARNLLEWHWPAFLTAQYEEVLPIITLSLVASICASVAFVLYDPPWFTSLANAVTAAIGFVALVGTYQVFPFDFSIYERDLSVLARVLLLVAMGGAAIGFIVQAIRLGTALLRSAADHR